jgi:segregation and condensation protein B
MGPDDEFEDDFGDEGDPLGFDPEDEHTQSGHSESVFIVDDEEAGRESFLERASQAFDAMAERAAFAEDLAEAAFVDADPTARDAASNLGIERPLSEEAPKGLDEAGRRHLRGLLEALLFVAERPMKAADLAELARADLKDVRSLLEAMSEEYREEQRGFQLDELAGGFQMRTSAAYAPFVRELTNAKPVRLSRAQVETLAIIASRQPITRPEVDDIRGVDAGAVIKLLLDRDLIRILGKKDEPGRPLLYGTTAQFLSFFGLKSLKDLPTLREFTELTDESREVVERELGEVLPEGPREPIPSNIEGAPSERREDTTEQPRIEEPPSERAETVENAIPDEIVNELAEQPEEPVDSEEPSSDTQREPEIEARADNDTEAEDEPSTESDYKPGGASYDPSDEDEFPDDDDTDDEDEDEEDEEEDDEEDEDDEDE